MGRESGRETAAGAGGLDETRQFFIHALDGDGAATNSLFERLHPRLVLWVSARLSKKLRALMEPEDVAQEIMQCVFRDMKSYRGGEDLRAFKKWLFTIAENRIRDLADRHSALKRQPTRGIMPSQTTPGTVAMRSDELNRMREAITSLPDDYRKVIQVVRLEERGYPEVAETMDRSENAVRILYCRALKALREEMTKND